MSPGDQRIRTLVVDDEAIARQGLRSMLAEESDLEIVGEAANGHEALALLAGRHIDLLFLDVQMPAMNGFDLLAAIDPRRLPIVVFTTAYGDHAIAAFEACALDYLLKPIAEKRLAQAVARAREVVQGKRVRAEGERVIELLRRLDPQSDDLSGQASLDADRFLIRTGNRTYYVDAQDIDHIDAQDYYARLWINGRSHLVRESLHHLAQRLDATAFLRIHRSVIVRLSRVREIVSAGAGRYLVVMQNGTRLRLARDRKAALHAALSHRDR